MVPLGSESRTNTSVGLGADENTSSDGMKLLSPVGETKPHIAVGGNRDAPVGFGGAVVAPRCLIEPVFTNVVFLQVVE
jgi:hypothetical protein